MLTLRSDRIQKKFFDFFFPPLCVGCGKGGDFLCTNCCGKLPRIVPPYCSRCGKPQMSGSYCPSCWGIKSSIDAIRSPYYFEGTIRKAIHELKYHNLRALADPLAELLYSYLRMNDIDADIIIPVPLHRSRLRRRGYNQSSLIATRLGKLAELPVMDSCLMRIKDSKPQARTKTGEERRENVAEAFICRDGNLQGRRVLLIDDVCTTGATLEACAETLKKTGVLSVWGLTIARES